MITRLNLVNLHTKPDLNMGRIKYTHILQWNCRGIKANRTDLQLLLIKDISVACLQEARLPHDSNYSVKYSIVPYKFS